MTILGQRYTWSALAPAVRGQVLQRPAVAAGSETVQAVRSILAAVRSNGDAALREFGARFDKVELQDFRVSEAEFTEARATLTAEQLAALRVAINNVRTYHSAQTGTTGSVETAPGVLCERIVRPIPAVGLYVPAGTAPLPSTVKRV